MRCSWCGRDVEGDEGWRLAQPAAERHAAFCRLEHVVPWALQGPSWDPGNGLDVEDDGHGLGRCTRCGDGLGDARLVLVRHRGRHRIGDAFCGVEHLREWASAGGRWG